MTLKKTILFVFLTLGTFGSQAFAMDQRVANLCNRSFDSVEKAECINRFYNSRFQTEVVGLCERFYDASEINQCLASGQNQRFDTRALNMCSRLYDSAEMSSCFTAIRGKTYESFEITACQYEYGSDLAPCLSRLGTRTSGGIYDDIINNPTIGNTIEDVLADAVDRMLRDLLGTDDHYINNRQSSAEYCRLENSSGTFLGESAVEDLQAVGSRYARDSNDCVVTNIKGRQRTRTVINSYGQIVGEGLTERETSALKNGTRCRVLTCVVDENSGSSTIRPTPTWSTY